MQTNYSWLCMQGAVYSLRFSLITLFLHSWTLLSQKSPFFFMAHEQFLAFSFSCFLHWGFVGFFAFFFLFTSPGTKVSDLVHDILRTISLTRQLLMKHISLECYYHMNTGKNVSLLQRTLFRHIQDGYVRNQARTKLFWWKIFVCLYVFSLKNVLSLYSNLYVETVHRDDLSDFKKQ